MEQNLPAVGAPVEPTVRPVAYVQRMGSYQGVPAYGCLLTIEAEQRMKVNDPLYDQAAIDAAVAVERKRWRQPLERVTDALAARLGTHADEWRDVDAAREILGA